MDKMSKTLDNSVVQGSDVFFYVSSPLKPDCVHLVHHVLVSSFEDDIAVRKEPKYSINFVCRFNVNRRACKHPALPFCSRWSNNRS